MKEKKYIDRLYQEKFKDFEASPRDEVWKSISKKLQEKQKKKTPVRPLWTRIGGVAALISLLLLIGDWFMKPLENTVVTSEKEVTRDRNDLVPPAETSVAISAETEGNISSGVEEDISGAGEIPQIKGKQSPLSETSPITFSGIEVASLLSLLSEKEPSGTSSSQESNSTGKKNKRSIFDEVIIQLPQKDAAASAPPARFEIQTHAAPIYYGNLGKGNFIDPQFNGNSSRGEITYSYGIKVAYAVSDNIKIRSGVNKVSMSYNTNDVSYHAVINPLSISSINHHPDNSEVEITKPPSGGRNLSEPVAAMNKASFGSVNAGLLNQKIGFIEVPVEMEYMLIDQKFQINVIGGASTLFLDENMISASEGSLSTNLGEANNLNGVSFSTNIGLGVDYNLTEQFKLNLEPMFKYQINTFNNASSDFQPYYLGIYSGFSFEF